MKFDECEWYPEPELEFWNTSCGNCFLLNEGGPTENDMKFCCYCGKPINESVQAVSPPNGDEESINMHAGQS